MNAAQRRKAWRRGAWLLYSRRRVKFTMPGTHGFLFYGRVVEVDGLGRVRVGSTGLTEPAPVALHRLRLRAGQYAPRLWEPSEGDLFDEACDSGSDCPDCGGTGLLVDCIDDMCQASGHCVHGDERVCRTCEGAGVLGGVL